MRYIEESDIQSVIMDVCQKTSYYGPPIKWNWNHALRTTKGKAFPSLQRIEFNPTLMVLGSEEDRYDTIVHEVCHVVAYWRFGHIGIAGGGHGPLWASLMLQCGRPAVACHSDPIPAGFVRKRKRA